MSCSEHVRGFRAGWGAEPSEVTDVVSWDQLTTVPWPPARLEAPDATPPVLVGLDGSIGGERALEWAIHEAAAQGAPVRALTAWSWEARLLGVVGSRGGRTENGMRAMQDEQISRVLRRVGPAHCRIDTDLVEGDPASTLLEASRTARLLVLGSRTGPTHPSLGAVTRACLRSAGCPVVVVPVRATA